MSTPGLKYHIYFLFKNLMSSRITIDTLLSKVEFIVLSLGGKPDEEKEINKKNEE